MAAQTFVLTVGAADPGNAQPKTQVKHYVSSGGTTSKAIAEAIKTAEGSSTLPFFQAIQPPQEDAGPGETVDIVYVKANQVSIIAGPE